MKRPAFQFYPGDWKRNTKLRRCSEAARGAWVELLCLFHDAEEYGVLRWPLKDIIQAAGVTRKSVMELIAKGVMKGADKGAAAYVFTPRHAGKDGEPVTLVEPGAGPCWYSSRFVRDEWIRQRRGNSSQFTSENQPPKTTPKITPKGGIGEPHGDGPSSSSSSSITTSVPTGTDADASDDPLAIAKREIWKSGKALFGSKGISEDKAGKILGQLLGEYSAEIVLDAVRAGVKAETPDPTSYLKACCQRAAGERAKVQKQSRHSGFENTDYSEGVTPDGRIA
jgi:hypothetical protein